MNTEFTSSARRSVLFVAAALLPLSMANAYETGTHDKLTLAAFDGSVMADLTHGPLAALGIEDVEAISWRSVPPSNLEPEMMSARELVWRGACL